MAKKSASELKAEGADLGGLIATARKRPLNFALLIGKEGVVLEAHPTKGADVMRRQAKANGGGTRGIQGVMNVSGKLIELTSEDDDVPGTLAKSAKRHLKERGLAYKVVIVLPSGERMDDGEDEEGDDGNTDAPTETEAATDEKTSTDTEESPATEAEQTAPESSDIKAELTARIEKLIPEVKKLVEQKADGAEKFGRGLQAAGAELAKEGYERAQQLLTAIEKGVADAKRAAIPTVDMEALRNQLKAEFAELTDGLDDLKDRAEKGVSGKADQLATMFRGLVDGEDLKKAGAVLSLIRTFMNSELGKLAEATGGIFERMSEAASGLVDDAKEMVEKGLDAADDFVDSLTEDGRKKLDLQALGFSEEDQDRLVAELATNPNAIKEAKAKLVADAGLPDTQRKALTKLSETDPKAFAAALETFKAMEAGGAVDVSPEKMQGAVEALETARKAQEKALADLGKASADLALITAGNPLPGSDWEKAIAASAAAEKAFRDYSASLPEPSAMTEKQRQEAMLKGMELDRLRKEAAAAIAEAKAAAEVAAQQAVTTTGAAAGEAQTKKDAAQKDMDAKDAKRGLMDAVTFGRLSPGAKPAFKDEDKASFIAAFAKDGKLAASAMDIAARSENPSAVAQNVGFMADKVKDGFAAADGKKLDLPEEDLRKMAQNAMSMGALQGEDYFKGFGDYLKSGKQLEPDPHGGMGEPLADSDAETQRLNKIALNRTSGLGAAAIKDGKVDFDSPEAKAAMDHMMFHPGSLNTFTPQMNQKMAETKALFNDPKTAGDATKIIDDTKLPTSSRSGRKTSATIIGGTMGKKPEDVTDADAKASVLSAMMTPLSQGPVGSCFSTAPVRAIRETDPVRAMGAFSKIASTGKFTSAQGKEYSANVNPPKGENPLMRSWEYSAATAAAELKDSYFRGKVNDSIWPNPPSGTSLQDIKGIVGNDAWRSTTDPTTGLKIDGVRAKLSKAMRRQLKFEYNAGPKLAEATPASGGDGKSTDGRYQLMYNKKALTSEAEFIAALEAIALSVTGEKKGETNGDAIVTLVNSAQFKADILSRFGDGKAPWDMPDGGVANETEKVLNGGNPSTTEVVGDNKPPAVVKSRGDRTKELLGFVMGKADPGGSEMEIISTFGDNCNHTFSALPKHPSQDKIRDPDSAEKIRKELIEPGEKIAREEMSVDEGAHIFRDHLMGLTEGAAQDERDLLVAALKKAPTTTLTPAELKDAIAEAMKDYSAAVAQKRADAYVAKDEPTADGPRKAYILQFYKDQVKKGVDAKINDKLVNSIPVPEVVVADSNWGGPSSQTLFVAAPDPITGELMMWEKDAFTGKLSPLGKNWEDANWNNVE